MSYFTPNLTKDGNAFLGTFCGTLVGSMGERPSFILWLIQFNEADRIRSGTMLNPCIQTIPKRKRRQPVQAERYSPAPDHDEQWLPAVPGEEQSQKGVALNDQEQAQNTKFMKTEQ